jgi:hypothetical protein
MRRPRSMGRDPNPERPRVLEDWVVAFGAPPPKFLSVRFMEKAITYEVQCKARGGLPAKTRRALAQIAGGKTVHAAQAGSVKVGTHLVREWNGRSYQVEVVEGGFRMDGKDGGRSVPSPSTSPAPRGPAHVSLVSQAGRCAGHEQDPLCHLHPQVFGRRVGAGVQLAGRAAGSLRCVYHQPKT